MKAAEELADTDSLVADLMTSAGQPVGEEEDDSGVGDDDPVESRGEQEDPEEEAA